MPKISDPYNELASMFLTGADSATPAPPPRAAASAAATTVAPARHHSNAPTAQVELLIVGNLPVRGSLWLSPYVDAVAQQHGAAALVRLDGPEPSIQLLRAPMAAAHHRVSGTMNDALADVGQFVDQWIIRIPAADRLEDLSPVFQRADRVTILTSADEAAVVAAYQIIKQLAVAGETAPLPPVGLAVVGAETKAATEIVDRLNRTTISFLGVELQLTLALPRIDAGLKSTRYVSFPGQSELTLDSAIAAVEAIRPTRAQSVDDSAEVAGRLYVERDEAAVIHADRALHDATPLRRHREPATAAGSTAAAAPQSASPQIPAAAAFAGPAMPPPPPAFKPGTLRPPVIKLAPKPAMVVEAKQPASPKEPDDHGKPRSLAGYVKGLTLLPIRTPGHEKIELAVDADGRLHLLAHEQSLRELPVVERWADAHRELIILACPKHPIDSLADVRCHVFADRPLAVADLHASDLSLHVLAPVQVNGQTAWYSAPLNAIA